MDRDAALAIVKNRLGNIQGSDHDSLIVTNMELAQEMDLEGAYFKPWFLLKTDQTATTTANTREVAVPTGLLEEEDAEGSLYYTDSDGNTTRLKRDSFENLDTEYRDEDGAASTGEPAKYSLDGDNYSIFPLPDDTYTLTARAYFRDDSLDSGTDTNNWLAYAADWFIAQTCYLCSMDLQYQKLSPNFEAQASKAMNRLYVQHTAREEEGRRRQMGDV